MILEKAFVRCTRTRHPRMERSGKKNNNKASKDVLLMYAHIRTGERERERGENHLLLGVTKKKHSVKCSERFVCNSRLFFCLTQHGAAVFTYMLRNNKVPNKKNS